MAALSRKYIRKDTECSTTRSGTMQEDDTKHTKLEICSYHPDALASNKKSQFRFFAFNLSTGQSIPLSAHDNVLSLCTHDIHFSAHGGASEASVVAKLKDIIGVLPDNSADNAQLTERATKFRHCLQSVLSLYSTCVDTNTDTNIVEENIEAGHHEIAFIELTFSIDNAPDFTNNFAAMVPIIYKNGVLSAMLPFNGCLWEEPMNKQGACFIQSKVLPDTHGCDARVTHLRKIFRDRVLMMSGKQLLVPFTNIENGRERRDNLQREKYMILRQNTETYLMLYGTLVSIGRSHELMTEHDMNMSIVQNVMLAAVKIFGHASRVSSQDLINNFFTIICYCMHIGMLGHRGYRLDVVGEDIRKRYVFINGGASIHPACTSHYADFESRPQAKTQNCRVRNGDSCINMSDVHKSSCRCVKMHRWNSGRGAVPLTPEDTLFEGFDCEDAVQSFMQIIQTAVKFKDTLLR